MEEELKLKEDIAKVFLQYGVNMLGKNKPFPNEWEFSDQILALIREAGYVHKSTIPNATICPKCNEMHWIR